jgi:2',3'-cyclic-nucleotide 2'-phosphodiesterase/3'-nucleotidase
MVLLTLDGTQIREILEHGLAAPYGVMEISGLKVVLDRSRPVGKRCISIQTDSGEALSDSKGYRVATNEFVLNGGDGYYTFARGKDVKNTHTLIRELVAAYIKGKGTIGPDQGQRYVPSEGSGETKDPNRGPTTND